MKKRSFALLSSAALLMSYQVHAYDLSWEDFEAEDMALITKATNSNDPEVLFQAGSFLIDNSIMQDGLDLGHEYIERAVKAGHDGAEAVKADMEYSEGNYKKALELFHKAEAGNDPYVLYSLGVMYFDGEGTDANVSKGNDYYLKAAKLGSDDAMYQLAFSYNDGVGVTQDYTKAAYWFEQAANKQNVSAMYNLGVSYLNGEGVETSCKKAMHWLEQAIEFDEHPRSFAKMGDIYYYPEYKQRCGFKTTDYAQAFAFFEKAAMLDNVYAQYMVGYAYRNGHGIPSDFVKALAWFEIADENGDEDAAKEIRDVKQYMSEEHIAKSEQYKESITDEIW